MKVEERFRAIAAELDAQKDRLRNLMAQPHYPTDGGWKESVLRQVLERHLPRTVVAGSGFIVDQEEESSQIDILLYNADAPLLHRDGELVVVTPDAVLGIIEVKTTARRGELSDAFSKLLRNARIASVTEEGIYRPAPFVGLFAYGVDDCTNGLPEWVLRELRDSHQREYGATVGHICLGSSFFVHYWPNEPGVWFGLEPYNRWHLYAMQDLAPGYFVSNIVEKIASNSVRLNRKVWYPEESKEALKVAEMARLPADD
jgi:hypothetical protein